MKTSAGLQDLIRCVRETGLRNAGADSWKLNRLVNLESVLSDTKESVEEVVDSIDHALVEDRKAALVRRCGPVCH